VCRNLKFLFLKLTSSLPSFLPYFWLCLTKPMCNKSVNNVVLLYLSLKSDLFLGFVKHWWLHILPVTYLHSFKKSLLLWIVKIFFSLLPSSMKFGLYDLKDLSSQKFYHLWLKCPELLRNFLTWMLLQTPNWYYRVS
jgi:hypothetical protein